jgi:UDP-N-acetylglucosamine--N-acetylmuramyl-(pentapeptide) pyrophosphoryl-undecaprenol N-acetylglucosamine transferase
MSRVLIMAGGTGGHVFPGLAVARALRDKGVEVVWMGTRKGLESRLVPAAGFRLEYVNISGLKGKSVWTWMLLPFRMVRALIQSWVIVRRQKPNLILSMGGFVAGPGGLVGWIMGKPLLIHEQNGIAGFTNRILSLFAVRIMTGFPGVFGRYLKTSYVGNPVRAEISAMAMPDARLAGRNGRLRVLVIGGSQGARKLNQVVADVMHQWEAVSAPEVWHQCGERWLEETRERYGDPGTRKIRVTEFIENMAEAFEWADVVICRSGAMTIAELAASGTASILVPFPHAADDHQTANAMFLSERDAAVLIPESQLTIERLHEVLHDLDQNRDVILKLATNARSCATPDACDRIVGICQEVMYA